MLSSQCSIESDPAYTNVGSEEFESKFVRHKMPAVANIATILLGIRDKELELQDKTSQPGTARQDISARWTQEQRKDKQTGTM